MASRVDRMFPLEVFFISATQKFFQQLTMNQVRVSCAQILAPGKDAYA